MFHHDLSTANPIGIKQCRLGTPSLKGKTDGQQSGLFQRCLRYAVQQVCHLFHRRATLCCEINNCVEVDPVTESVTVLPLSQHPGFPIQMRLSVFNVLWAKSQLRTITAISSRHSTPHVTQSLLLEYLETVSTRQQQCPTTSKLCNRLYTHRRKSIKLDTLSHYILCIGNEAVRQRDGNNKD